MDNHVLVICQVKELWFVSFCMFDIGIPTVNNKINTLLLETNCNSFCVLI